MLQNHLVLPLPQALSPGPQFANAYTSKCPLTLPMVYLSITRFILEVVLVLVLDWLLLAVPRRLLLSMGVVDGVVDGVVEVVTGLDNA